MTAAEAIKILDIERARCSTDFYSDRREAYAMAMSSIAIVEKLHEYLEALKEESSDAGRV